MQAFEKAEFVVTHDYFMTDTARLSDVVLPVTTFVERSDILFSHTNYLYYSAAAIAPVGGARNDWDIFADLAGRLGFGEAFTGGKTAGDWIAHFLQHSEVDDIGAFLKNGIYSGADQYRVGLSDFARSPQECPLATESGRIEVACGALEAAGGGRIPVYSHYREAAEFPLRLITPHERFRNNSQFDNVPEFARLAEDGVRINPQDAADRGIEDGDAVIVSSPHGRMYSIARLSSDILPGVISCTQGKWFQRTADRAGTFRKDRRPEASFEAPLSTVNVLTSSRPTLPSRGARTHSVMVNICKKEKHREPEA
jgi:anaerobic selenocysteine-containing dehydrogenase